MQKILVYTVHKAASIFLHRLTIDVTNRLGINYYSIHFKDDFNSIKRDSWKSLIEEKAGLSCFGPIRSEEHIKIYPDKIHNYSIILHLRDPRDVLTSLYFSYVYSHPRAEGRFNPDDSLRKKTEERGIDAFVLSNIPSFKRRYEILISALHNRNNVKIIRYEDMILNFSSWLSDFLFSFWQLDKIFNKAECANVSKNVFDDLKNSLSKKYYCEFTIPASENKFQHKRQIKPGDHKNKLNASTINTLNKDFDEILRLLSYR